RIGDRADVRMNALEVAQDVEVQRGRLDALRPSLAQAREMVFGRRELRIAENSLLLDQFSRDFYVARHEHAEGEFQVVEQALVERDQLCAALLGKLQLVLDLLGR